MCEVRVVQGDGNQRIHGFSFPHAGGSGDLRAVQAGWVRRGPGRMPGPRSCVGGSACVWSGQGTVGQTTVAG